MTTRTNAAMVWIGRLVAILVGFTAATLPVSAAEQLPAGSTAIVGGTDGTGMGVRSGPGMGHKVITTLPDGSSVLIVSGPVADGDEDWYQVSSGSSVSGWGRGQFLQAGGSSSAPSPVASLNLGASTTVNTRILPNGRRTFVAKMTAYADGVGGVPLNARTATGTPTRWGVVAVDPKVVPLGSTLMIDGYGDTVFTAEDIGGGIKGNAVDIWLPDPEEAKRYGTQHRLVTILTEGKAR